MASTVDPADDRRPPRAGDVTLCLDCATLHIFKADLTLRLATEAEIEALHPEAQEQIRKVTEFIQGRAYEITAQATFNVVGRYKGREMPPLFQFPAVEIALLGSLADIGKNLVRNRTANELLIELMEIGGGDGRDFPTAMMLRTCLHMHKIPWLTVPLAALGLKVGTT